jgi:glycosyltransferase involved in cell wall biosynthesis
MQKTNFPFEVLIGEDCSSDNTRLVIEKYIELFPKLIKLVTSSCNVGMKDNFLRALDACQGEYIAICEGDDYWIASDKLQIQIDLMKQYPKVNISFHPAYQVVGNVLNENKIFSDYGSEVKVFPSWKVILGGGGFMPTASLIIVNRQLENVKQLINICPVGDLVIQQVLSLEGNGALYIPFVQSVYRTGVLGSWSASTKSIEKQVKHYIEVDLYYKKISSLYLNYWFFISLKRLRNMFSIFNKKLHSIFDRN